MFNGLDYNKKLIELLALIGAIHLFLKLWFGKSAPDLTRPEIKRKKH